MIVIAISIMMNLAYPETAFKQNNVSYFSFARINPPAKMKLHNAEHIELKYFSSGVFMIAVMV